MTPFGLFLQNVRGERNLAQKQLAGMVGIDQSYLSGLESGRKGAPPPGIVTRLKDALELNERDAVELQLAAEQSRRKFEIPIAAAPSEYILMHAMAGKLGHSRLRSEREGLDRRELDELLRIVDPTAPDNPWVDIHTRTRNELIIWWLCYLGVRRGELLGLRVSDLDFRSETATIHRRADDKDDPRLYQPNAKTQARELPMSSSLAQRTREYVISFRNGIEGARKHDFLFVASDTGRPLSINGFAKIFYALQEHPLLPQKLFAHLLRHTWNDRLSEQMDENATPEEAERKLRSYLMGWSETSGTASTYTRRHVRQKAAEASVAMQNALFKGRTQ